MTEKQAEIIVQLIHVSSRMHASSDIASIMRLAVSSCMQLVDVSEGASGLLLENQFAFAEYYDGDHWRPMQRNFDDVGMFNDLISELQPQIITSSTAQLETEQMLALPVVNEEGNLLACLILFQPKQGEFSEENIFLLMQVASIMASAIENSIRHADSQRIEADLEKSVATYRTLVEQIPAITYISSLDRSQIIFVSPQVEQILGYSQADFLANQEIWLQRIHPDDREHIISAVQQSIQDELPFHAEYRMYTSENNFIWVKDAADVVRDQGEDLYVQGVLYDVTERKENEEEMIRLAHYDPLTGLANRALFLDRINHAVAQAKRHQQQFAVMYLDLDGFKAVNDQLGHQAGDELLAEAARRLRATVREVDTVARMGGDEFTIILSDVGSQKHIHDIAKKLVKVISQPYDHIDQAHTVTLSMGIAIYPQDSTNHDELITLADDAMYEAKNRGKNCFCFHKAETN